MKKVIVAVFAHPDDESFGPGGTIAILAKTSDVYIVTVTGGEAGDCSITDTHGQKLANIRHKELVASAKILGVKKVFCLGFEDGALSNNLYHSVASKIEKILIKLSPTTVITFDNLGISGHLDHIAVSMITTYVVQKLSQKPHLWYYFVTPEQSTLSSDYFVYFPKPVKNNKNDIEIDTTDVWDIKKKAMLAHVSQSHDAQRILKNLEKLPKKEYFHLHNF